MSADGQRTKWRRNIAENFNRLSRVHERYRQTTDDRRTDDDYSEREREFAINYVSYILYTDLSPIPVRSAVKWYSDILVRPKPV